MDSHQRRALRREMERLGSEMPNAGRPISAEPSGGSEGAEKKKRRRDVGLSLVSFLASVVIGVLFSKPVWASIFLGPAIYFALDCAFTFIEHPWATAVRKVSAQIAIAILLVFVTWHFYLQFRYEEQEASVLEGQLTPLPSTESNGIEIQIGNSGTVIQSHNEFAGVQNSLLKFAFDAGLHVSRGLNGVEISTPVRDRSGNLVGEIDHNHWKVYPPFCSDKNYDDHRLEIKDGSGHVVLQVVLFKDRVQIQGEWRDPFGHGVRLIKVPAGGADFTYWNDAQQEEKYEQLITPIFQYPSSSHWGELAVTRQ